MKQRGRGLSAGKTGRLGGRGSRFAARDDDQLRQAEKRIPKNAFRWSNRHCQPSGNNAPSGTQQPRDCCEDSWEVVSTRAGR